MKTGILRTYQNNSMSLSCDGSIVLKNGIVQEVNFKGYPRTKGDTWTGFYQNIKRGDIITNEKIERMLRFDGYYNVKSYFKDGE